MINKSKIILIIFITFFCFYSNFLFASEIFNFDVKEVEIKENGNKFIGKKGGVAKSVDGTIIKAENFDYNKDKNILIASGKVQIYDPKNNIKIYSDKVTYLKNLEIFFTDGNSRAIEDEVQIDAKDFEYNKRKNQILASGNVKINNKKDNYLIYSDKVIYSRNSGEILTRNNSKALLEDMTIFADFFKFNEKKNILKAEGNVKVIDKIENYTLETEYLTYDKINNKIFTKNDTKVYFDKKYEFFSNNVFLYRNEKKLNSEENSSIKDNNSNIYKLSKFLYFYDRKFLKGEDVEVQTNFEKEKSDKFYFKNAFIDFSKNSFVAKNTKINIHKKIFDKERVLDDDQKNIFENQNDPRIYGSSSSGNNDVVIVNKGIFTSCKKTDKCPPWSMKADQITHDRLNQNIKYENAVLNLYDFPVFYFPKFFHPDPTVKRRSGLLQPRLNNSNVLGSSISVPYFHTISDNKDFTFKPTIFDNNIYMFQNEYRQENKHSSFIADFSYTKGYQSKISGNNYNNRNSISHLFSKLDFDLKFKNFTKSKLEFFVEKVNNDTYLKVFENVLSFDKKKLENDLKDKNNLTSGINLTLDNEDYNFKTGFTNYENLQKKNNDRYQQVLPYYNFSKSLFSNTNGTLNFSSDGRNILQNTNNLRSTVTNTLTYTSSDLFTKKGFANNFGAYFKNLNGTGKNDAKYKSSIQSELLNIYEINSRYPLFKENENFVNLITPKISFRFNPSDMKNYKSETRLITADNIFSINRLGLSDTYEAGKSLTLGLDFKRENKNNIEEYFEIKLATLLRDDIESRIPTSSSLDRKTSNLFGSVENSFSEFFSLNYDFALDNDLNKFEHNAIEAEFAINNFITTFNFIEKDGETGDVNTLENKTSINFDDQNSLIFKTRRNRKISLTEYYDLVYEYKNDCLTAGIKYRKTYYQDRDLKPKEDLFFTITFFPLTTLDQKIDENIYRN